MVMKNTQLYDELALYTLQRGDRDFIHQYIVDAYAAQHADETTKPVTITFALAGLYLHIEKGYSGKEVQNAHIKIARKRKSWLTFTIPDKRSDITVADVLKAPAGAQRDEMIDLWSRSVWRDWSAEGINRKRLIDLLSDLNILPGDAKGK